MGEVPEIRLDGLGPFGLPPTEGTEPPAPTEHLPWVDALEYAARRRDLAAWLHCFGVVHTGLLVLAPPPDLPDGRQAFGPLVLSGTLLEARDPTVRIPVDLTQRDAAAAGDVAVRLRLRVPLDDGGHVAHEIDLREAPDGLRSGPAQPGPGDVFVRLVLAPSLGRRGSVPVLDQVLTQAPEPLLLREELDPPT